MAYIPQNDIKNAFRTLFGPQLTYSEAVLNYLQPSGIKSAYREQVKACHPDLAHQNGRNVPVDGAEFARLQEAYHLLLAYKNNTSAPVKKVRTQSTVKPSSTSVKKKKTAPKKAKSFHTHQKSESIKDFFYNGHKMPSQKLKLGEYLYYSKIISWKTLINALVYKKQFSDKKLGEYFIEKKLFSNRDLYRYLTQQQKHNLLYLA